MNKIRLLVCGIAVSASCLVGIAGFEAYRGTAYMPTPNDKPTLGFGETAGVKMGDKTTPERALIQLQASIDKHADGIRQCIKVPLHQHEFDSMVSLSYNIGTGAFCGSTLVKKLNAGDHAGACEQIKRWDKQAGKVLPGLTKRREAEYQMCMGVK